MTKERIIAPSKTTLIRNNYGSLMAAFHEDITVRDFNRNGNVMEIDGGAYSHDIISVRIQGGTYMREAKDKTDAHVIIEANAIAHNGDGVLRKLEQQLMHVPGVNEVSLNIAPDSNTRRAMTSDKKKINSEETQQMIIKVRSFDNVPDVLKHLLGLPRSAKLHEGFNAGMQEMKQVRLVR